MKNYEAAGEEKRAEEEIDMEKKAYYERLFFEVFNHVFDPGDAHCIREMRSLGYEVMPAPKSVQEYTEYAKPVQQAEEHKEPDRMEQFDENLCEFLNELQKSGNAEEWDRIREKLYAEMAEEILTLHKTVLAIRACGNSTYNR